ncbi:hypothetical protein ACS0TY_010665 [Phlomoides rotata]
MSEEVPQIFDRRHLWLFCLQGVRGDATEIGKMETFIWNALSAALRSKGHIVLNITSSGIASLLLPGRRTAHSRFAIPLDITDIYLSHKIGN